MRTKLGLCLAAMALVLLNAGSIFAQATASGTISGTVFDQSQAVITTADVVITSKATGDTRTVQSNDLGNFRFDLLTVRTW